MDATTSINKTDWAQSKSFSSAPSRSGVEDDGYPLANRLVLPAHSDEIDGAVVEDGAAAVEVRVAVRIAQMLKVESNTFRCTFDLELSWRDDSFRPVVDKAVPFASIVWSRHFRPKWFLANCVELHSLEADAPGTYALAPDPDTRAPVVRQTRRVVGTFFEPFALRRFPLDVQGLSICVASTSPLGRVTFVDALASSFDASPFAPKLAEWIFLVRDAPNLALSDRTPYTSVVVQEDASRAKPRSVFVARMPVRRKAGYYLGNVVPTYFTIVVFGWMGYANDTADAANRLNYLAALLLSVIAFKFTWKEKLPRVLFGASASFFGSMLVIASWFPSASSSSSALAASCCHTGVT